MCYTRIALTKSVQFTGSSNSSRAKETDSLSLSLSLKSQSHQLQPIARRSVLLPEIQKTSRNTDATRSVDLSEVLPPIQQAKSVSNSQSSLLVCVSRVSGIKLRTRSTATGQNSAAAATAATVAHVRSRVNCHGQGAASTDANSRRRTPDCDGAAQR
jgi:hypothetical protein